MISDQELKEMDESFDEILDSIRRGLQEVLGNYILIPASYANNIFLSNYSEPSILAFGFQNLSIDYSKIFQEFCK